MEKLRLKKRKKGSLSIEAACRIYPRYHAILFSVCKTYQRAEFSDRNPHPAEGHSTAVDLLDAGQDEAAPQDEGPQDARVDFEKMLDSREVRELLAVPHALVGVLLLLQ